MSQCRICLGFSPSKDLFSSRVCHNGNSVTCQYIMTQFFSLSVSPGDGLPSKLCKRCVSKLSSAYKLKMLAEKSYIVLLDSIVKNDCDNNVINIKQEFKYDMDLDEDRFHSDIEPDILLKSEDEQKIQPDDDSLVEKSDDVPLIEYLCRRNESSLTSLKITSKILNRNKHIDVQVDVKLKTCHVCEKRVRNLPQHMKIHNQDRRRHQCSKCPKTFAMSRSLRNHMKIEHLNAPYYCKICKRYFRWEKAHIRSMHTYIVKNYQCSLCTEKFSTPTKLNHHISSHNEERPFLCVCCGKTFKSQVTCDTHRRRVHEREKNYECDYCAKKFFSKNSVREHLRMHTKERNYKCDECGKTFPRQTGLKVHLKRHSGIKTEKCHLCNRDFINRGALNTHMISHTKVKNYDCKFCGAKFGRSDHRNRHERTAHMNLMKLVPKDEFDAPLKF